MDIALHRLCMALDGASRAYEQNTLDSREFFWVGDDANGLDQSLRHFNGQEGEYLIASAEDESCLAVDFR